MAVAIVSFWRDSILMATRKEKDAEPIPLCPTCKHRWWRTMRLDMFNYTALFCRAKKDARGKPEERGRLVDDPYVYECKDYRHD